jgi:hypothetical protein
MSRQLARMLGRKDLPHRSEFALLRPGLRLLIIGLAGWVGLVAVVTVLAVVSVEVSTMSAPAWWSTRAPSAATADPRSRAGFEDISQRPLFSRSRKSVSVAQPMAIAPTPSTPPQSRDQNIKLKGVFIDGTIVKAFVTSTNSPFGSWIAPNGEIGGWRVAAVTPDQIVLNANAEKLVIPLTFDGPSHAGVAPATNVQPNPTIFGPRQNPNQIRVPPQAVMRAR